MTTPLLWRPLLRINVLFQRIWSVFAKVEKVSVTGKLFVACGQKAEVYTVVLQDDVRLCASEVDFVPLVLTVPEGILWQGEQVFVLWQGPRLKEVVDVLFMSRIGAKVSSSPE